MDYKPGDQIIYHDPVHGKLLGTIVRPEDGQPGWYIVEIQQVHELLRLHDDWMDHAI